MKKLRVYLDTSVINFLFAEDAPDMRDVTIDFFEHPVAEKEIDAFISDVVLVEINRTPDEERKRKLLSARETYDVKMIEYAVDEIEPLVEEYLARKIIPVKKVEDAQHVAIATVTDMDVLASWNFRHLANITIERKIMLVNNGMGYYHPLRFTTPMELIG